MNFKIKMNISYEYKWGYTKPFRATLRVALPVEEGIAKKYIHDGTSIHRLFRSNKKELLCSELYCCWGYSFEDTKIRCLDFVGKNWEEVTKKVMKGMNKAICVITDVVIKNIKQINEEKEKPCNICKEVEIDIQEGLNGKVMGAVIHRGTIFKYKGG